MGALLDLVVANLNGSRRGVASLPQLHQVCDLLDAQAESVIMLQEVVLPVATSLAERFPGRGIETTMLSPTESDPGMAMGLATVSTLPVLGTQSIQFSNPRLESRQPDGRRWGSHDKGALLTRHKAPDGSELTAVNVHALPFRRFDVEDTSQLVLQTWQGFFDALDAALAPTESALFVAGDFNLDDRSALDAFIEPRDLSPQFEGRPTRPSGRSTDDLYARGAVRLLRSRTVDIGSDHFALVAHLELG